MANVTAVQLIEDGPRHAVIKVTATLDTADVAALVIADPATLIGMDNTGLVKAKKFRVKLLDYNVPDGFAVNLFWQATAPVMIVALNGVGENDYTYFGGIPDNSGAGSTGAITLSTLGWVAAAVRSFSVVLVLTKQA